MPSILTKLKAARCRVDGVVLGHDGTVNFVATHGGGAWTEEERTAAQAALGMAALPLAPAQAETLLAAAIEAWLDAAARRSGYSTIAAAVSYQSSGVDLWRRQAAAFAAWRDAVWQGAFAIFAHAATGTVALPGDAAALIAALPQPDIPTT